MDLYYMLPSAPCRSVLMTAKALGVELNTITVDLMAGDHLKPEFLKINPQHSIPTLVDNGLVVCESRAIMIYLAENYGKRYVSLYPTCPQKRALINQRLFFDMGTLYQRFSEYFYPHFIFKAPPNPEAYKKIEEAFGFFDIFLDGEQYAAGNRLSLADIALVTTVSTIEATGFDVSKYPNVDKWYKLVKEVTPGYEINKKGLEEFKAFLNQKK